VHSLASVRHFLLPLEKGIPTRWSGDSTNNFREIYRR
jgi:hypothetical protein